MSQKMIKIVSMRLLINLNNFPLGLAIWTHILQHKLDGKLVVSDHNKQLIHPS